MNDVRFEIEALPEPELGQTHRLEMFDLVTGESLEVHILDDPYGFVEAFRETQAFTFEERMDREFEREYEDRHRW